MNPLILHGQTHGGIAQGAGQALMERCVYAAGSGQLLSGSFMDYAMPRADDFPSFVTTLSEVPSTNHPLGFRGGGEGGITPALGVIVNAVVDALADLGVAPIEMPASPQRVWQAHRAAAKVPRRCLTTSSISNASSAHAVAVKTVIPSVAKDFVIRSPSPPRDTPAPAAPARPRRRAT